MTTAQEECEDRAAKAEEAEHFWAQDYADEDAFDMWTRRAEAIDFAKSSSAVECTAGTNHLHYGYGGDSAQLTSCNHSAAHAIAPL